MKSTSKSNIVVLGPTASGKTAYAISLAKQLNGAIISADSRQVYAGMNIGTAKPQEAFSDIPHSPATPDIIYGVPHYLLTIASSNSSYTLSDWLRDAAIALEEIKKSKKIPIITGGTMLYIDALVDGYDVPNIEPNPELRKALEQQSPEILYKKLQELDPVACTFIEPHNTRRIIRALEVIDATGEKFSDLRRASASRHNATRIGIFPGWDSMKINIESRSHAMLRQGLVHEAVALREKYPASPLLATINYKEALQVADGVCAQEEAAAKMSQATLRYAHRQMSWWNRRSDIGWICV
ncbi:MAG TPA: tRNA (adenosine(37)-N6)-dimethylallyltransferase MiaA [Candidatus Andersenbacteria bacterium]|nr:tRNA (adenosine(37)-N6)-dimethylallyltransferase MiaA [Candidatus Andersenbacteria bacterium]